MSMRTCKTGKPKPYYVPSWVMKKHFSKPYMRLLTESPLVASPTVPADYRPFLDAVSRFADTTHLNREFYKQDDEVTGTPVASNARLLFLLNYWEGYTVVQFDATPVIQNCAIVPNDWLMTAHDALFAPFIVSDSSVLTHPNIQKFQENLLRHYHYTMVLAGALLSVAGNGKFLVSAEIDRETGQLVIRGIANNFKAVTAKPIWLPEKINLDEMQRDCESIMQSRIAYHKAYGM